MAFYRIVKQESVSGYNLDGSWQETDEGYVLLMHNSPIYMHEDILQVFDHLKGVLCHGDRIAIDLEV